MAARLGMTLSSGVTRSAAPTCGVDIIQNCEVTGFIRDAGGSGHGVETTRGGIGAARSASPSQATPRVWRRWPA